MTCIVSSGALNSTHLLRAEQHSSQVFEDVDAAAREYWRYPEELN